MGLVDTTVRSAFTKFSRASQARRKATFQSYFQLNKETKILDLGAWNGDHISRLLDGLDYTPSNITLADIDEVALKKAHEKYGFDYIVMKEGEDLPFEDDHFDVVYCNSVIEHVTIPKSEIWDVRSSLEFKNRSLEQQHVFAKELARIGKEYFVQTPHRHFPIESHTWLPLVAFLPRPIQTPLIGITNKWWVKGTDPDWYLLDEKQLQEMFPEAKVEIEMVWGFPRSIMAIYKNN